MRQQYSKLRIAATDVIISALRCLKRGVRKVENKEAGRSSNMTVVCLFIALVIACMAIIVLCINVGINTSNDKKLAERVKAVELRSEENAKDVQFVLYLGTNDKDTNHPVYSK